MKQTVLYVMRHGQTTHNRDDVISGHVDPDLTEQGVKQAHAVKDKLSHIHFDEVYSSDLQRAAKTASIVYGEDVPSHHQFFELRERSYGHIEGTHNDNLRGLREKHKPRYDALPEDERWKYKHAEDMESDHEVAARFITKIRQIAEDNLGKTVLIGTHGGALRVLVVGLGYMTTFELPPSGGAFKNGAFVKLIYDGKKLRVDEVEGFNEGFPLTSKK
jgi:broad specificity phosphatase PhoE